MAQHNEKWSWADNNSWSLNCTAKGDNKASDCRKVIKAGDFGWAEWNKDEPGWPKHGDVYCSVCATKAGADLKQLVGKISEPEVMIKLPSKPFDSAKWADWGWAEITEESHADWGFTCYNCDPLSKTLKNYYGEKAWFSFTSVETVGHIGEFAGEVMCSDCAQKAGVPPPNGENWAVDTMLTTELEPEVKWYQLPEINLTGYGWRWFEAPKGYTCNGYITVKGCHEQVAGQNALFLWQKAHVDNKGRTSYLLCESCAADYAIYPDNADKATQLKSKVCLGCSAVMCSVCAMCHTEGCNYEGYKVNTPVLVAKYAHLRAKTQKVRGYVTLADAKLNVPKPYSIVCSDDDVAAAVKTQMGKRGFVRPCPIRARHGFVDSRPMDVTAESGEAIKAILAEAIAADEEGKAELLIVPYIESAYNAIVTPSRVAIGPGHDGATAGHESMMIPLAGVPFPEITLEVLSKSKVAEDEDPYIEAVIEGSEKSSTPVVYFTQLRAGVKIPATVGADYVPFPMRVEQVLVASGDLIEWEAQAKAIVAGTVVVHVGGTLISHYGVHCMQNDIPIFTSRQPEIGEALEVANRMPKPNPEAVIRGLVDGVMVPVTVTKRNVVGTEVGIHSALVGMMVTLHNSAAMSGEDGYWLGMAVSTMFRVGMAASHGEARHKVSGWAGSSTRNTVYKMAFKDFFDARGTLGQAQYRFKHSSWESGYGGKKWAECTDAIIKLDVAVRLLMQEPTEANVAQLVTELNNAVNQAHNGGWWLNKFIEQSWFTRAGQQRLECVVLGAAAMYYMKNLAAGEDRTTVLEQWRGADEIVVAAGKMMIEKGAVGEVVKGKTNPEPTAYITTFVDDFVKPTLFEYVGLMCPKCGTTYSHGTKKNASGKGVACGHYEDDDNCTGKCGWYENGKFAYLTPEPEDDDSDEDDNPIAGCQCPDCMAAAQDMGDSNDLSDDVDAFYDDEPVVPTFTPTTNVGGIVPITADSQVVAAQFNIHKAGQMLHVQFRTGDSIGYYSFNVNCKDKPLPLEPYEVLAHNDSWSGSEVDNYVELGSSKHIDGYLWSLHVNDLTIWVNIKTMVATATWSIEVKNEETPQTKIAAPIEDDCPF